MKSNKTFLQNKKKKKKNTTNNILQTSLAHLISKFNLPNLKRKKAITYLHWQPTYSFAALLARVTDRYKKVGEGAAGAASAAWVKFSVNVMMIYKRNRDSMITRGAVPLYVQSSDLACRCPKIKPNQWVYFVYACTVIIRLHWVRLRGTPVMALWILMYLSGIQYNLLCVKCCWI